MTRRLLRRILPIVVVCFLLWALGKNESPGPISVAFVFALCGSVLWFGWSGIQSNLITKWLGIILALAVGLVLSIFILGIVIRLSLLVFVLFLVALPFLTYDLLFRSPSKGRLARAQRPHLGS